MKKIGKIIFVMWYFLAVLILLIDVYSYYCNKYFGFTDLFTLFNREYRIEFGYILIVLPVVLLFFYIINPKNKL
jgi:preprotein translocase subunit SecE